MLSMHAQHRMRDRGIPPVFIDWLEQYGAIEPQNGAELIYFNHRSLKRLASYTGGLSNKFDKLKNVYLVRGNNGKIVTAGYRNESIKRK
ncbi:MAG: hypothetical protein ACXWTP_00090 [Methylosarcina sp.]